MQNSFLFVSLEKYKEMHFKHSASVSYQGLTWFFPHFFLKFSTWHQISKECLSYRYLYFLNQTKCYLGWWSWAVSLASVISLVCITLRDGNYWTLCFILSQVCKTGSVHYTFQPRCHQSILGFSDHSLKGPPRNLSKSLEGWEVSTRAADFCCSPRKLIWLLNLPVMS